VTQISRVTDNLLSETRFLIIHVTYKD